MISPTTTPTKTGCMKPNLPSPRGLGYRPVPVWHEVAAKEAGVETPTIRDWAAKLPQRIVIMLRAMIRNGAQSLAELWMVDFEAAFVDAPASETAAWRAAVEADADEDVKRDEYLRNPTPESRRAWLNSLKKEVAAKLRKVRVYQ